MSKLKEKQFKTYFRHCQLVCKPSSVLDSHLSRLVVTNKFKRCFCFAWKNAHMRKLNLASSGVYRANVVANKPV